MKKAVSIVLVLCVLLGLTACGSGGEAGSTTEAKGQFMAGFGLTDITPRDSVPMASYGDDRMSTGWYSNLEARAVAVQDENGDILVFVVGDVSWCPMELGGTIQETLSADLGIPKEHIILSGTHTHASVSTSRTDIPSVGDFNKKYINGMVDAAKQAVADLKPAQVYVGSVQTKGLTFVRRYIMDDGSYCGDNFYGTGTKEVGYATKPDEEMQMMKFVREGGEDILIANFQAHPNLEGRSTNISAQVVGAFRDAVEKDMGIHCLYWQGAAGNLNSYTRLAEDRRTTDRVEWGQILCNYAKSVYDDMTQVQTGPIKVNSTNYTANVNHAYDDLIDYARLVDEYFKEGCTAREAAEYAWSFDVGIHSVYHARRIISNASLPDTKTMYLLAWSFGDIAGVVLPYELYDESGMQMKQQSPYVKTFIVGYSYPAYVGYIPTADAFDTGSYEADNCTFEKGTAEKVVEQYLNLLNEMHG